MTAVGVQRSAFGSLISNTLQMPTELLPQLCKIVTLPGVDALKGPHKNRYN
jgi:hypothetical protein